MNIAKRGVVMVVGFLKSYGPTSMKKILWDKEFSGTKWDFINDTAGDCVYAPLEKYARNGSILDLGCGPGNTANEVANESYQKYVGVDISDEALAKARKRTVETGRESKNSFVQSDFINYEPSQKFDVILFRESIYHVPMGKIKETLDHFSRFLNDGGVFVVRIALTDGTGIHEKPRPASMVNIMETEFELVERFQHEGKYRPTVLVLKPKRKN
jgi:ubiquinone/menaquinone biosynthesis C-methylase UbiE